MRAVMGRQPAEGSPKIPDPQPAGYRTTTWDMLTPQRAAVLVADALAAEGPILSAVAACSTGLHSLVRAVQWASRRRWTYRRGGRRGVEPESALCRIVPADARPGNGPQGPPQRDAGPSTGSGPASSWARGPAP